MCSFRIHVKCMMNMTQGERFRVNKPIKCHFDTCKDHLGWKYIKYPSVSYPVTFTPC